MNKQVLEPISRELRWSPDKAFPFRSPVAVRVRTKKDIKKEMLLARRLSHEGDELVFAENWMRPSFRLSEYEMHPTLRVKGYAQDRVVLTQYFKSDKPLQRKLTRRKLSALVRGSALLDKRRESRRGLRIGGRLRFKPAYTKFTLNGKNFVKDAAHLLEHMSDGMTIFVTLTLPGGTKDAFKAISVGSGYIVDRFNRWVRYKTDKGYFLYVWEVQKRGAPHLHYMLRMPYGTNGEQFTDEVRAEWRKILRDVSQESGVDVFERKNGGTWIHDEKKPVIDIRSVWGNCGSYMAKYMSKADSKANGSQSWSPGRWWGVSAPLRELVNRYRFDERIKFKLFSDCVQVTDDLATICKSLDVRFKRFSIGVETAPIGLSFHCLPGKAKTVSERVVAYTVHRDVAVLYDDLKELIYKPPIEAPYSVQGVVFND